MENTSSHQPDVEYDFYEPPQPSVRGSTLRYGSQDGEYLYEKPTPSKHQQATFSNVGVVYYDVEPDSFEPEAEYIVEYPSRTKKNEPKSSTEMAKGSKSGKKVIQDVYDEDGYTLARPYSNVAKETNRPRNTIKKEDSNQTEGNGKKKIVSIVIGIILCCIICGAVAGILIFALGNYVCTKDLDPEFVDINYQPWTLNRTFFIFY